MENLLTKQIEDIVKEVIKNIEKEEKCGGCAICQSREDCSGNEVPVGDRKSVV